jgi:nitrous oxidase accessory protein NosD
VRRFGYGVYAEGSTTAEIRGNALIADSVGAYLSLATDSAVVVGNTVDSSRNGLSLFAGQETRVDSNLVRVTSAGAILFVNMNSAVDVRANTIDSAGTQGINFTTSPGGRVAANSISRTQVGILLNTLSDSTILTGNVIDQSGADGVNVSGSLIRADSNKITNSGLSGLVFYVGGSGRLTRNRFQNNGSYGVGIDNSLYSTSPSLANNIIQGNVLGGANNGSYPYATMDADSNYWGDPNGPRCNIAVTGVDCSASVAGDSVLSAGITFTPFLSSPPGGVPAAPPARPVFSASRRPVSAEGPVAAAAPEGQVRPSVLRGPRLSEAPQGSQPAASRPGRAAAERQETQRKSFPMAWQKGREPRQPRPPATRN